MQFSETDQPKVELLDKNYIDQLLQNYTLSVTHLSNYLDCPLRFYFQCLIRVPSGKSPSATFGQAVHWALNKAFKKLKENGDEFPLTDDFMREFRWYMYRNRDSFTKEDFKLRAGLRRENIAGLLQSKHQRLEQDSRNGTKH